MFGKPWIRESFYHAKSTYLAIRESKSLKFLVFFISRNFLPAKISLRKVEPPNKDRYKIGTGKPFKSIMAAKHKIHKNDQINWFFWRRVFYTLK